MRAVRYALAELICRLWRFMPMKAKAWAFLNARPFPGEREALQNKKDSLS